MRLLLDTNAFLWWLADEALHEEARQAIARPNNAVFVSAVSFWEISIKKATGKLKAEADLIESLHLSRFQPLDITAIHAVAAGNLPMHHKDPFDRMLVAQAIEEGLTIVTRDPVFKLYKAHVLSA